MAAVTIPQPIHGNVPGEMEEEPPTPPPTPPPRPLPPPPPSGNPLVHDLQVISRQLKQMQHRNTCLHIRAGIESISLAIAAASGSMQYGPFVAQEKAITERIADAALVPGDRIYREIAGTVLSSEQGAKLLRMRSYYHSVLAEFILMVIIFPGLILLACVVLGGFLAVFEDWSWSVGFEFIVTITCGLATPIGQSNNFNLTSHGGKFCGGIMGMWAIALNGLVVGWASDTKVVNFSIGRITGLFGGSTENALHKAAAILICIFLVSPALLLVFVFGFGALLAFIESWRTHVGGYYLLASVAGLPNPLTSENPVTRLGIGFGVIVSTWGFILSSIIIGFASNLPFPTRAGMKKYLQARLRGYRWMREVVPIDPAAHEDP